MAFFCGILKPMLCHCMRILLTNDDSHNSPLLHPLLLRLKKLGEVTVCVPAEEKSWTGKCLSRFGKLTLNKIFLQEEMAYSLSGFPADCVNVGIYHLFGEHRPDLIVSGINAGLNTGMGFVFSSGTVGACFEANIAGIPAIAFSQQLDRPVMRLWRDEARFEDAELIRLKEQMELCLDSSFEFLLARKDLLSQPLTWNINFPSNLARPVEFDLNRLSHSTYGSCFVKSGDGFIHSLSEIRDDMSVGADLSTLQAGKISIVPIDLRHVAQHGTSLAS